MLYTITTNGVKTVVDAVNKAAANAYGAARVDMSVEPAALADLPADVSTVPVILKGGKTQEELDKEAAETKEKAEKKAAKKTE